jgi:hypothetical protein
MPTGPGGPGGPGGGGGGAGNAAAIAAIQTLFQNYNRPTDTALLDQLTKITGQAQTTGATAMDNLRQQLGTFTNPYQGAATAAPGVPAEYAAQAGGQWNDMLRASYEAQMQGRQQDAAMSQTSFQQSLANNNAAMQAQIAMQEKKQRDDMMMSILQMAVQNGVDLSKIGVTF